MSVAAQPLVIPAEDGIKNTAGNRSDDLSRLEKMFVDAQQEIEQRFEKVDGALNNALGNLAPRVKALLDLLEHRTDECSTGRVAEEIPCSAADPTPVEINPEATLFDCVSSDNGKAVLRLLNEGANIEERNSDGDTALHIAASKGFTEVVEILMSFNACVTTRGQHMFQPLHCASANCKSASLQILLCANPPLDEEDVEGATPLALAAEKGNKRIVKLLLTKGAKAQTTSCGKKAPLIVAIMGGHSEIVKLLLDYGASPNVKDSEKGYTALMLAVMDGNSEMVKMLLDKGGDTTPVYSNGHTALIMAVSGELIEIVRLLVKNGAQVVVKDANDYPAVFLAVLKGNKELVNILLEKGVSVETKGPCGKTILQKSISEGKEEVALLLLEKGASATYCTHINESPLKLAVIARLSQVVNFLLQDGARLVTEHVSDALLSVSCAPVTWTFVNQVPSLVKGKAGIKALCSAVCKGCIPVLDVLLKIGLDPNTQDAEGWNLLHIAVRKDHVEAVRLLLDFGADLSSGKEAYTPLHTASAYGNRKSLMLLLEKGAMVNSVDDSKGATPLHEACANGSHSCISSLLNYGADIEARNALGYTPLHVAASVGHIEDVKILIEAGAITNVKNCGGQTPHNLATIPTILELLSGEELSVADNEIVRVELNNDEIHEPQIAIVDDIGD